MAGRSGSAAASGLADAFDQAEAIGRGRQFRPWKQDDDCGAGELALEAFRLHGAEGMRLVFDGYRDGVNGDPAPGADREV